MPLLAHFLQGGQMEKGTEDVLPAPPSFPLSFRWVDGRRCWAQNGMSPTLLSTHPPGRKQVAGRHGQESRQLGLPRTLLAGS